MVDITAAARPALASLSTALLVLSALSWAVVRRVPDRTRNRLLTRALLFGCLAAASSALLVSRRHSGMGTEIARGWPRVVHARWESFDASERRSAVLAGGLVVNALVFGVGCARLLGALDGVRQAARFGGSSPGSGGADRGA
ncbi:MAG TPA: hypothetical protein VE869_12280 [Gemmatimonas sp.]|nr:hypothetical protein [Gemmatimonas sp.]